jgi:hypothetical protein
MLRTKAKVSRIQLQFTSLQSGFTPLVSGERTSRKARIEVPTMTIPC